MSSLKDSLPLLSWLIVGGNGWIGRQFVEFLSKKRPNDVVEILDSNIRANDEISIERVLTAKYYNRVVSFIGRTHGPGFTTIDYLEQKNKLKENIQDNLFAPIVLALLCYKHNIHYTYLGTGCIFNYDKYHSLESGKGFQENDLPNFSGSAYSIVKGFTDRFFHLLDRLQPDEKQMDKSMGNKFYNNKQISDPFSNHFLPEGYLNVRIRMPISDQVHARNFITKITSYEKICSTENSMTVLPELLPILIDVIVSKETGTLNLTNPGTISHNRILELYKEIVDQNFVWTNFTVEEQAKILAADRSNNKLDTHKLQQFAPHVLSIEESVRNVLLSMKQGIDKDGIK